MYENRYIWEAAERRDVKIRIKITELHSPTNYRNIYFLYLFTRNTLIGRLSSRKRRLFSTTARISLKLINNISLKILVTEY